MSRNFKVVVETNNKKDCVFIIRPHLIDFDNFKDEIFIRMPQLKGKPLKYHYEGKFDIFISLNICVISNSFDPCFKMICLDAEGDRITIFNGLDFGIFLEQELNKIFVAVPCKSFTHDPLCLTNFYSPSTIRGWGTTARGLNDLNRFPFDTQTSIRSVGTTAQEIIKEKIIAKEAQPKEIASTSGNIERPKSPLPSSSKSNEDVLKRMSSAYEKIINEKLTEPDNPLRIEPSLGKGTFALNSE